MDEKDIEKTLKDSADKIRIQDFSTRWTSIKNRIDSSSIICSETVTEKESVLVTSNSQTNVNRNNKYKFLLVISGAALFLVALILSIVLPLTLRKNDLIFSSLNELTSNSVAGDVFYNEIENSHYDIADFSDFEVSTHYLFKTVDKQVKGGGVECFDEASATYMLVYFYDSTVLIDVEFGAGCKEVVVNNIKIKYETEIKDDAYSTVALAQYKNMSYKIEYLSLEENATKIFEKIFVG